MTMTENEAWQIFKNTGSIEAYLTFSSMKNSMDKTDGNDDKNKGNNTENDRHPG